MCVVCVCLCAPAVFWALTIGLVTKTWPSVSSCDSGGLQPLSQMTRAIVLSGWHTLAHEWTLNTLNTEEAPHMHRRTQMHDAERQDSEKNRNHRTQTLPVSLTDTWPINTHISVRKHNVSVPESQHTRSPISYRRCDLRSGFRTGQNLTVLESCEEFWNFLTKHSRPSKAPIRVCPVLFQTSREPVFLLNFLKKTI